jgi:hypothetical protein
VPRQQKVAASTAGRKPAPAPTGAVSTSRAEADTTATRAQGEPPSGANRSRDD